jgi:hypothetical protein
MKVVVLANLRWHCLSPSWYRLLSHDIDLVYSNDGQWYLSDGKQWVPVPDRDTGAMLLAKQLNSIAAGGA